MKLALFIHIISLVIGFGAVLCVDYIGLLWVVGKRKLHELISVADNFQVLIWLGFCGLITSGLFLSPDLSKPRTIVKLVAVAIVGLNGINLHYVNQSSKKLRDSTAKSVPKWFLVWSGGSITLSQIAWWCAIIIGFITANTK